MNIKSIVWITAFVLMVSMVFGGWVVTVHQPTETTSIVNRNVNFSLTPSVTDFNLMAPGDKINVSIFVNGTYFAGPFNVTNNTFFNVTVAMPNGYYNWTAQVSNGSNSSNGTTYSFTVSEPIPSVGRYELLNPGAPAYELLASTNVNFSWRINLTNGYLGSNESVTCDLYNRSSTSGSFGVVQRGFNITNATFFNFTRTMAEGRTYWYVNCSNDYQGQKNYHISTTRIFDIENVATLYRYQLDVDGINYGMINFTLNTGDLNLGGNMTVGKYLRLMNQSGSISSCGASNIGSFMFNGSPYVCNASAQWAKLVTTV